MKKVAFARVRNTNVAALRLMFFWRADGEGNEEAEDNMEEVRIPGTLAVRGTGRTQHPLRPARRRVQVDKNLDQMGTLITGLNSMAVVRALRPQPTIILD